MTERVSRAELVERVRVLRRVKEPSRKAQEESLAEQLSESGVTGLVMCDGSGVLVEQKRKALRVDPDLVVQVLRRILDGSDADESPLLDAHGEFFAKHSQREKKMRRKVERINKKQQREENDLKRRRIKEAIEEAVSQHKVPDE
jgi:hypothetical protein